MWEVIPSAVQDHVGHLVPQASTVGMKRDNRIIVADNLQAGWLAFQCEHEKRRLAPVPEQWNALDDDFVVQLLEQAETVHYRSRLLE